MTRRDIVQGLRFRKPPSNFEVRDLEQAFERGYLAMSRGDKFTTKTTFAPSSVGGYSGVCARYWVQAFNGAMFTDTTDAMGIANMENGSYAHKRLENVLEKSGVLVEAEREFWIEDPPIHGFIDAIVNLGGDDIVGELKTTRNDSFMYRKTTGKPMAQHLYQVLIYMHAMNLESGFLFYENKDDQTFVILPVQMTPENRQLLEDAFEWLREVRRAWENKMLPKRLFSKVTKECKTCPMWSLCWDNPDVEDGDIKIKKMAVPPVT